MTHVSGTVSTITLADQVIHFFVVDKYDVIQREHFGGAFYEPEELAIIAEFFPRGGVYVDIGANVGNHLIYICKYLHPLQSIVFEPNPLAASVLELNVALNGLQWTVDLSHMKNGLSDCAGKAQAIVPAGNLGGTRMVQSDDPAGLTLIRGDTVLLQRRVDFIKMDVEGMEMQALSGLSGTIAKWRPAIFIEVDNQNSAAFQDWVREQDYTIVRTFRRYAVNENYMILPNEFSGSRREQNHLLESDSEW